MSLEFRHYSAKVFHIMGSRYHMSSKFVGRSYICCSTSVLHKNNQISAPEFVEMYPRFSSSLSCVRFFQLEAYTLVKCRF